MDRKNLDFLGRLVGARSVSSKDPEINMSNKQATDEVAAMLEEKGLATAEQTVPGLEGKFNVVGRVGPESPGAGLVLAGHVDTVPCNPERWDTDPFEMVERDGILYGLGVCDMKGFFGIVAEALDGLDQGRLKQPLQVWATAEEECGMEGAEAIVEFAPPGAAALVGEPTSLIPIHGHKGALAGEVVTHGRAGHSSNPAEGANAISAMTKVMAAMEREHLRAVESHTHPDFLPPEPTLGFNRIEGGDSHNRITDRCMAWFDRRLNPGENADAVISALRAAAEAAVADIDGVTVELSLLFNALAPVRTDPDRPIIRAAVELSGSEPQAKPYATEASFYAAAGMDVLIMGAGHVSVVHQPNECLAVADMDVMVGHVRSLIDRFCC